MQEPAWIDEIKRALLSVPGLPHFAVAAIAREVAQRVTVWQKMPDAKMDECARLPELFAEAAGRDVIEGLLAFAAQFGGHRVYVPQEIKPDHYLYAICGPAAAKHLSDVFGGLPMSVPKADRLMRVIRNRAIIEDYERHGDLNKLITDYGLTYPWVLALVTRHQKEEEAKHQPCLPGMV